MGAALAFYEDVIPLTSYGLGSRRLASPAVQHHIRYSDTLKTAHGPVLVEGLGMDEDPLASRYLLVDGDGQPIVSTT
jgi:hypothetical protein